MQKLSGYLSRFKNQIEALQIAYDTALNKIPARIWSWGGGTALSLYYFRHRNSFDIDIFIDDPQYFGFLSPKWFIDDAKHLSGDYQETANHIQLLTLSGIKIDFLLAPNITGKVAKNHLPIAAFEFYVDTVEEIVAKKLRYRRKENKSRDIFDIAVALKKDKAILTTLWETGAISIDEIIEWDISVQSLDMERYKQEIEIIAPSDNMRDIAMHAKEIISEAADTLRQKLIVL